MYTLIVNRDGHLSAMPTTEQFQLGDYATNPAQFVTFAVEATDVVAETLYHNRDRVLVISTDTPIQTPAAIADPNYLYVQVVDGSPLTLVLVAVPDEADLTYARFLATSRLSSVFAQKKQGRFAAGGHWYDGSDFLLFAIAFVMRGQPDLFACASSESAPFTPVMHTVVQIQEAGGAFATWYQGLQATFYEKQSQLVAATSVAQIEGISWV